MCCNLLWPAHAISVVLQIVTIIHWFRYRLASNSASCHFLNHHQGCLNNPIFRIWGYVLHVEHISCVITNCDQHQWAIPTLFSIALGLAGGKHYQKIINPVFNYYPCSSKFCCARLLSYSFLSIYSLLSSGWVVIAACGSVSVRELPVVK